MKSQAERQREYRARLKGKNVTCNISNEAFELLKNECEQNNKTRSAVIERALIEYLGNKKQTSEKKEPVICPNCEGYGCENCNDGWIE